MQVCDGKAILGPHLQVLLLCAIPATCIHWPGWGGTYVECARILESALEWLKDWETNLRYCMLS